MNELSERERKIGKLGIAALFATHMIGNSFLPLTPFLVGGLIEEHAVPERTVGLIISLFMGSVGLSALLTSSRIDRLDRRRIGIIGVTMSILGNLTALVSPSLGVLVAARIFAGLGEGAAQASISAIAARTRNPERMFAILTLTIPALSVLLFTTVPSLMESFGVSGLFMGLLALQLLVGGLVFWIPRGDRWEDGDEQTARAPLGIRPFLGLIGIGFHNLALFVTMPFFERIGASLGVESRGAGFILATASALALGAPLLVMYLGTRFGRILPIFVGGVMLSLLFLTFSSAETAVPYYIAGSLLGLPMMFVLPYQMGLLSHLDPSGRVAAAAPAFVLTGNTIGPAVGGFLASSMGYGQLGWVSAIGVLIAASLFLMIGRTKAPGAS